MRAQIAKTEYLPAEYIPLTFLTRTPSPFSAGWRWGLLSRKIFYFFLNPLSTRSNYTSIFIFFLIFARNLSEVWIENILNFTLVILTSNNFLFFFVTSFLFGFVLDFIQNICSFNSLQVFTRHSSSASFYIHHVWISRFQTLNYDSFLPVEFYSHQFRLVSALSIILFDSLSL